MSPQADSCFCATSVPNRTRMPAFTGLIGPVAAKVLPVFGQRDSMAVTAGNLPAVAT